jgi:hypothetical protein
MAATLVLIVLPCVASCTRSAECQACAAHTDTAMSTPSQALGALWKVQRARRREVMKVRTAIVAAMGSLIEMQVD